MNKTTLRAISVQGIPAELLQAFDAWWPRRYASRSEAIRGCMRDVVDAAMRHRGGDG